MSSPINFTDFKDADIASDMTRGWTTWTPRAEIAPTFRVDPAGGRRGRGALLISGQTHPAAFGEWRRRIVGITPGATYRFTAYYKAQGVVHPRHEISARIQWLNENGDTLHWPNTDGGAPRQGDYVLDVGNDGEWTKTETVQTAPVDACCVLIQLGLRWSPAGTVWWDDVRLVQESAVPSRIVRVGTVFHRPRNTGSAERSVAEFCNLLRTSAKQKLDIVCLPEGVSVVGTGKNYAQVAETIPGPSTEALGEVARELGCYLVAGVYEKQGSLIYNTAVLVDRAGLIVGMYRKTHLPQAEADGGLTPGDAYPVFQTDFGKVGIMVCWDVQFPEPARALALKGAEIILLPIWGGNEILCRARAIENHVFLVTSSYDIKTFIVDPLGEVLAEATKDQPLAVAEIDLDRAILQPWLGDMKTCTWKERRPDLSLV